jgi:hypothetical protein
MTTSVCVNCSSKPGDLCPVKTEVDALRKTVEALRAMIEVRPDGSASWRIPRMKNER